MTESNHFLSQRFSAIELKNLAKARKTAANMVRANPLGLTPQVERAITAKTGLTVAQILQGLNLTGPK